MTILQISGKFSTPNLLPGVSDHFAPRRPEVQQAATRASRARESVAWLPNTMPNKLTTSQDHIMTIQQAGGSPTAAQGRQRDLWQKKHKIYSWKEPLKKDKTI